MRGRSPLIIPVAPQFVSSGLLTLALVALASVGAVGAQPATGGAQSDGQPREIPLASKGTIAMKGVVDLRAAPTITSPSSPPASQSPTGASPSSNFVGGGALPLLVKNVDGLNSVQAGGASAANPAIATDLSYVMEGVDNAIGIYRTSTGALAFGPYSTDTFFQPVKQAGDTFTEPQMYYDTMRDHWIVLWLEKTPGGLSYLDLAISATTSPTQPNPGAQYHEYQIPTQFQGAGTWCDYPTLGVEYYSITITCIMYTGATFTGNTTVAINKGPLLTGGALTYYTFNNVMARLFPSPLHRISPALEEGVQDAEFLVGIDVGFSTNTIWSGETLCALTNLPNIGVIQPTFTCVYASAPGYKYLDPLTAEQPGGPRLNPGSGPKQVFLKAGRLFFAYTGAAYNGFPRDFAVGLAIQPRLQPRSAHNPQWISGVSIAQPVQVVPPDHAYAYAPTLVGSDEGDWALIFTYSDSTATLPSLRYGGRKASDGEFFYWPGSVTNGSHAHGVASWGQYSSCAVPLNSVTRGTIWCVSEYPGTVPSPGWNTRLFALRLE